MCYTCLCACAYTVYVCWMDARLSENARQLEKKACPVTARLAVNLRELEYPIFINVCTGHGSSTQARKPKVCRICVFMMLCPVRDWLSKKKEKKTHLKMITITVPHGCFWLAALKWVPETLAAFCAPNSLALLVKAALEALWHAELFVCWVHFPVLIHD